tara:strand:- start:9196 stop:13164 length:3969 start_codon:yes stop_codon:yes gene_type:complete
MAKNQVYIDIVIDDKGTTKRVAVNAKKLGLELDKAGAASDKASKGTDKLGKSAKDLDRNMRGTAKMTSNSSKEFSKMQQGMGGLVGAYATLAAQVFAVSAAFQFLQGASDFRNLIAGQEALGAVSGAAYKTITNSIIQATDAQIRYADAARAAAIGTAAGLTSSQLTELGTVAKNASFALGRDLTDSFNRLVRGVTKAEPELLDELGIILRLETATEKYALVLNKSASELTAFERSQAVANEVLEQGTRKFAEIEALMDPNAAALQQFAKSFDDLFNSFKVGVIEGLTPVLQFLSKNTLALTASLALFAIPIIKAILPNLQEWKKNSMELYKDHESNAKGYIQRSEEQSAILAGLTNNEKELAKAAKDTAKARGKTTDKGGVGYVAGGASSPQARAAAKKGLALAEEDLRKHGEVRTGIFKGYTAKEVAIARASYNKREGMAKKHGVVIGRTFDQLAARGKMSFLKLQASWAGTMAFMSRAATIAATTINVVMSLAGIIGVITMLAAGLKAVYDYFFPLSEAAKQQAEEIGNLAEKYKDLDIEMSRARQARESLTTGTGDATNIGQALQSADVQKLITDINDLSRMTDKGSQEFLDLQQKLKGVAGELVQIDPKFAALETALEGQVTAIDALPASELINTANGYMEIGQAISGLPETIGKADEAFVKLSKSMIKTNPLDQFLEAEKAVLRDLQISEQASLKKAENIQAQKDAAIKANEEQAAADEAMYKRLTSTQQAYYDKHFANMDEEEKKAYRNLRGSGGRRNVKRGRTIEGTATAGELENFDKRKKLSEEEAAADKKRGEERAAREAKLAKLRDTQLKQAKDRVIAETNALNVQTRGVTLQGQLLNLELSRVKNANTLQLAQEKYDRALTARDTAKKGTEDRANAQKALEQTKLELDLAKANNRLQEDKVAKKEEEIALQQKLLGLKVQELQLDQEGQILSMAKSFEEKTGGGTFESAARIRQMETMELENALAQAQNAAEQAAAEYDRVYNEKLNELKNIETQRLKDAGLDENIGEQKLTELQGQATAEATVDTGNQVGKTSLDVTQATLNLQAQKETFSTLTKQNDARLEAIQYETENFAMTKEQEMTNKQILALRQEGVKVTDEMRSKLLAQNQAEADAQRGLEQMKSVRDNMEQGLGSAFEGMITGAKSAKEAFKDMAKSMLANLAKIIAQELALRAIRSAMGFFADGGISARDGYYPSFAGGGTYASPLRNYSKGGMARGPQQGYNAVLHGNEAVVPLPHNRKIPVELKGGAGGDQNNVTVNVAVNNDGTATTRTEASDGMGAERLGTMVAQAVQDELQNQKRSGGILSPYGAA